MKRLFTVTVLLLGAVVLASCGRDESEKIIGSYTYKTSGTVTFRVRSQSAADPENPDTIVKVALDPEQGQMHIVSTGADGAAKVTFNDITGNVDVSDAIIDGSTITIVGSPAKEVQFNINKFSIASGIVSYSGTGTKYDGTLIADFSYQGGFTAGDYEVEIVGSDVRCVAQYND